MVGCWKTAFFRFADHPQIDSACSCTTAKVQQQMTGCSAWLLSRRRNLRSPEWPCILLRSLSWRRVYRISRLGCGTGWYLRQPGCCGYCGIGNQPRMAFGGCGIGGETWIRLWGEICGTQRRPLCYSCCPTISANVRPTQKPNFPTPSADGHAVNVSVRGGRRRCRLGRWRPMRFRQSGLG